MIAIREISAEDTHAAMTARTAVLVDVRETHEIDAARIPGAYVLPLSRFDPGGLPDHAGKTLILSCAAGGRSLKAAEACARVGITALNMTGGIMAWTAAGLPVERGPR